jgi:hypothetical protein
MYCPECGSEYREGFFECADCQVALTAEPPAEEPHPDLDLVTVMTEEDPARLALAESLLMDAEIPYAKKGEQVQDLFGMGRLAFNPLVGPVLLQVAKEHAEEARALLDDLEAEEEVDYSFYDNEQDDNPE